MIFKAVLSNKAHPEYGAATIPFPIPDGQYDSTIDLLHGIGVGDASAQDCRVDEIPIGMPILNRLVTQSVNVDELDYLAKRLNSFDKGEELQFQAMASVLGLSDIKDLINLTFCCQQATVITDFSDLNQIGKHHRVNLAGGMIPAAEYQALDGQGIALDLIQSGAGVVTPYGVAYDNGMKLEDLYDGYSFPPYQYGCARITLGVQGTPEPSGPVKTAWLYLPAPDGQITRALRRIGIMDNQAAYYIEDSDLLPGMLAVLDESSDSIEDLNRLCQRINVLDSGDLKKLEAVTLMANPQSANELRQLSEHLDQFDFLPCVDGQKQKLQITNLGYVAYHGAMALDELMREAPAEAYQREQQMGGLA